MCRVGYVGLCEGLARIILFFWPIVSGPSARARRLVRFGTANENFAKSAVCGLPMMTMIIHGLRVPSGVCGCLPVFSRGSCGIL